MTCTFPLNKTLIGMEYSNGILSLQFGRYRRTYEGVDSATAYRLAYSKSASDVMSVFSNEIKGKFKVVSVLAS